MTINRINVKQENKNAQSNSELPRNNKTSFKGAGLVLGTMNGIEQGGFAASFIAQDMLGMAFPRIGAGLFRNRDKTGECNWKFAAQETLREFITGPSAIAIPFAILFGARKYFGKANGVPAHFIKGLGADFAQYAKSQPAEALANKEGLKEGFYKKVARNMLETSTNNGLKGEALEKKVTKYTELLLKIDAAEKKSSVLDVFRPKKTGDDSTKNLMKELYEDFIALKKAHIDSSDSGIKAIYKTLETKVVDNKTTIVEIGADFKDFIGHLRNYTADATKSIQKNIITASPKIEEFVKSFNFKRMGSRFMTNVAMTVATIMFFTTIPKIYKRKNGNPGLAGLDVDKVELCKKEVKTDAN